MPQGAEIRWSNIVLFGLRSLRVPQLMKQVLVLILQSPCFPDRGTEGFWFSGSVWPGVKWIGWSPKAPFLARFSGTLVWSLESAAFGTSPTRKSLPTVCRFQSLWIAAKKCEIFILCCYVCLPPYTLFIRLQNVKIEGKNNILFQNLTIAVFTNF